VSKRLNRGFFLSLTPLGEWQHRRQAGWDDPDVQIWQRIVEVIGRN